MTDTSLALDARPPRSPLAPRPSTAALSEVLRHTLARHADRLAARLRVIPADGTDHAALRRAWRRAASLVGSAEQAFRAFSLVRERLAAPDTPHCAPPWSREDLAIARQACLGEIDLLCAVLLFADSANPPDGSAAARTLHADLQRTADDLLTMRWLEAHLAQATVAGELLNSDSRPTAVFSELARCALEPLEPALPGVQWVDIASW